MDERTTHIILGIHITRRHVNAMKIQELLTEYGCHIKTRLGLHHVHDDICSPDGLMLLHMCGDEDTCLELGEKLGAIPGLVVKKMVFQHED
ncbi:hypothetical protein JXA80_10545 [bacterium]|nr:hypothetical protein [candidate division CSSED10-310 bacterium]